MKGIRKTITVGLTMTMLVSGLSLTASAAGFATGGVGIKARAMGGAFRGVSDDWSAASYNPAGLAFLTSNRLNATLGTYTPRLTYTPNIGNAESSTGFELANGLDIPPIDEVWPIPSLAMMFVPESMEGVTAGLAIYWPHDVNYGWDLFNQPAEYNSDFDFPNENMRTDLDVLDIHPVIAKRFGEKFSLGAGLSLTNGDLVFRRVLFVENTLGQPFESFPPNEFIGDLRLDGNGFSVGANVGMMWKPSETFSFGFSVQSPVTVPLEGDAELNMAWPINKKLEDIQLSLDRDNDRDTEFDRTVYAGNNNVSTSAPSRSTAPWEFDLQLPGTIGAGIGWLASERLMLAVDASITFWSALDDWDIRFLSGGLVDNVDSLRPVTSMTIPFGWDDQLRVALGADYQARENVAVRWGGYYETGAAVDESISPNFPDVGDHFGITGGFAYNISERWEVAAAQEIAFFSDRAVASNGAADGVTSFPGAYALTRYETLVSLGYRF